MALFYELNEAVDKVLQSIDETDEFKRGFKKLIENFIDNSYTDDDIREMLTLAIKEADVDEAENS